MYAYVDETGNTGKNLFDKAQPTFVTAALMSREEFDVVYGNRVVGLAESVGKQRIHANELGLGKIELITPGLLKILKQAKARFFLSRVEKKYLAATKLVDTIFDSGENLAVPWHVYNFRPLRLQLVFKIAAFLVDESLARAFWLCLMEPNETEAHKGFIQVCKELLSRLQALPDQRSRELVSEALGWAIENPEAIYLHVNSKLARYGHLPNMVAFISLLEGIEDQSRLWRRPVKKICHDRQMQFDRSLKFWHELLSNASPDPLVLPFEEPRVLRRVFASKFVTSTVADSPGIQATDVVLWLYKRIVEGNHVGPHSRALMLHVFRQARHHVFSFESVSRELAEFFEMLDRAPITEEQMRMAKMTLGQIESRRQAQMLEYAEKKVLAASSIRAETNAR